MRPADRAHLIGELPFHGEWGRADSPLATSLPAAADVHWTSAARRISLAGSASAGLENVESGGVRLVSEPMVPPAPAAARPARLLVTPSEACRIAGDGSDRVEERWMAALDLPVAFWEAGGSGPPGSARRWRISAGGHPLAATIGAGGRVAIAEAGASGPCVALALDGGRFEPDPEEARATSASPTGSGRMRLMIVVASDDADFERTLQAVARKGLAGLVAQRAQHERLLREYGAALSTPLSRLDWQFEWAKALADEQVRSARSAAAAEALLGAGLREGARELLKAGCGALAGAWAAWAGGDGSPEAAVAPEPPAAPAGPPAGAPHVAADLPPLQLLRWVVTELWGIAPDAPAGAVSLAPRLPAGWTRMTLARIRVGGSAIDCELRARGGDLVVRVRRSTGPPLIVTIAPTGIADRAISVDGITLGGGRARFEAVGEHELVFASPS